MNTQGLVELFFQREQAARILADFGVHREDVFNAVKTALKGDATGPLPLAVRTLLGSDARKVDRQTHSVYFQCESVARVIGYGSGYHNSGPRAKLTRPGAKRVFHNDKGVVTQHPAGRGRVTVITLDETLRQLETLYPSCMHAEVFAAATRVLDQHDNVTDLARSARAFATAYRKVPPSSVFGVQCEMVVQAMQAAAVAVADAVRAEQKCPESVRVGGKDVHHALSAGLDLYGTIKRTAPITQTLAVQLGVGTQDLPAPVQPVPAPVVSERSTREQQLQAQPLHQRVRIYNLIVTIITAIQVSIKPGLVTPRGAFIAAHCRRRFQSPWLITVFRRLGAAVPSASACTRQLRNLTTSLLPRLQFGINELRDRWTMVYSDNFGFYKIGTSRSRTSVIGSHVSRSWTLNNLFLGDDQADLQFKRIPKRPRQEVPDNVGSVGQRPA